MGRRTRILIGSGLLTLGATTVLPGLIHPVSREAVLNAEVVTVRAPIEGVLQAAPLAIGDRVLAGQSLGRVRNQAADAGRRDQAALDLAVQRRLAHAANAEVKDLAALDHRLSQEVEQYRQASMTRLTLSEAEAQAKVRAAEATLAHARLDLARRQTLRAKGFLANSVVEVAQSEERAAVAGLDGAKAGALRVEAAQEALRHGIFVADGLSNVPYSRQRLDEVHLRLLQRRSDAAAMAARVIELSAQLDAEDARLTRLGDAEIHAPAAGVVWQRFAAEGDGMRAGDPVLGVVDCRSLFLTAVLPKRFFADIKAGDEARARLLGEAKPVPVLVQSVRAAGAGQANTSAAVIPTAVEGRDVVVTLEIHGDSLGRQLGSRSDNLCQVGQHASVTFAIPALQPLFDAVAAQFGAGSGNAS
jgi:multidrug resistance efflux pump